MHGIFWCAKVCKGSCLRKASLWEVAGRVHVFLLKRTAAEDSMEGRMNYQETYRRTSCRQTEEKVRRFVKENDMIPSHGLVIAGISGGSDSSVMLSLLCRLQKEIDFQLQAVHVNHQIRGEAAERDEEFVRNLCGSYGVSLSVVSRNVPLLAKKWGVGEEEAGRIVRRNAWKEEAERLGAKREQIRIAVAHNQNDLAETVIHHLARGTGLRGIASMRPVNGWVIRPMLCLSKEEIEDYAKMNRVSFVVDQTNASDDYTRNRIRHHVLPLLQKEVNEKTCSNLAKTAELAAQAVDYLESRSEELLKYCEFQKEEALLPEKFREEAEVLQDFAIRKILERLGGSAKDLSMEHIRMVRNLFSLQVGKKICLPYELWGIRVYEGIRICHNIKRNPVVKMAELRANDCVALQNGVLLTRVFSWNGEKIPRNEYTKWFDYDKIGGVLTVRKQSSGDWMRIHPDGGKKPVRRIMIDSKIPSELRESIPLVTKDQEVLWIVGVRSSEAFRVSESTRQILEIKYQGGDCDGRTD